MINVILAADGRAPACCRIGHTSSRLFDFRTCTVRCCFVPARCGWLRLLDRHDREDGQCGIYIRDGTSDYDRTKQVPTCGSNFASGLDSILTLILTLAECPDQLTVHSAQQDIGYEPITLVAALVRDMRQLWSG